ncbi:MAG: hypothetical protein KGL35_17665 [Bradyrhizobium sp.]|nr:hypothetical protein [Bradyrhizobium sp.]
MIWFGVTPDATSNLRKVRPIHMTGSRKRLANMSARMLKTHLPAAHWHSHLVPLAPPPGRSPGSMPILIGTNRQLQIMDGTASLPMDDCLQPHG